MPNQSYEEFKSSFLNERQVTQNQRKADLDALNKAVSSYGKMYQYDPTDPTKLLALDMPQVPAAAATSTMDFGDVLKYLTGEETTQAAPTMDASTARQELKDSLNAAFQQGSIYNTEKILPDLYSQYSGVLGQEEINQIVYDARRPFEKMPTQGTPATTPEPMTTPTAQATTQAKTGIMGTVTPYLKKWFGGK